MPSDWSRVVNTTTSNFIKGEEINIVRNRKILALLRSKGRITFNWGGDNMVWRIRYKRAPLQGYLDSETLTFPRRDRWKTATLEWRGYAMTDSMTKGERLKNKSVQQIVNIYDTIAKALMEDIDDHFGDEFYVDGNASGNSRRIHGIESFLGGATPDSDGFIAVNNDTFAGLSTVLQTYGGTWSGDWPSGSGSAEYDFWTPLLVDYTDGSWSATTDNWPNNAIESLRFGIIKSQKNKAKRGKLDLIVLEGELYRQFLDQLDEKERINLRSTTTSSQLIKMGFSDVQNFDGVDVTWEYGTPADTGYGLNCDQMELRSMQGQLFQPEGPDYDIASKSWRFSIDFYGNMVWNPRYFVKWKNYS